VKHKIAPRQDSETGSVLSRVAYGGGPRVAEKLALRPTHFC
jgi:hypothetical protein